MVIRSVGVVVCALAAASAHADVTVFNLNRAGWEAATGSFTNEAFTGPGLSQSVASFALNGAGHTPGGFPSAGIFSGAFQDRLAPGAGNTTVWAFSTAVTSFGADWDFNNGGAGTGIDVKIDLLLGGIVVAGAILNPSAVTPFVGFWGFTSTIAFDTVILSTGPQAGVAETYSMDNLGFTVIPLPAPVLMAGSGLLGLAAVRFARRRTE